MPEKNRKTLILNMAAVMLAVLFVLFLSTRAHALTAEELETVSGKGWHKLAGGNITYIVKGQQPAVGFRKLKKRWYHFDENGYLSLGWFTVNGHRYFATRGGKLGTTKGSLKSGYAKADGVYYMFAEKQKAGKFGRQKLGWVKADNRVFYYDEEGTKLTGLQEIKGKLYFFAKKGGAKKVGMLKTGWRKIKGKKYYFRTSGKVGKKYGSAYRNKTVRINGVSYTFGPEGYVSEVQVNLAKFQSDFIEKIGKLAQSDMKKTGVLASVTIAQAIIESDWGRSKLATKAKNLFGMKAALGGSWTSSWDGKVYKSKTKEYLNGKYVTITDSFRKYKTIKQSVADHSAYLLGSKLSSGKLRYAGLKGCKDYEKAIKIIKKGGYATAHNYVSVLVGVVEKYNLDVYDS